MLLPLTAPIPGQATIETLVAAVSPHLRRKESVLLGELAGRCPDVLTMEEAIGSIWGVKYEMPANATKLFTSKYSARVRTLVYNLRNDMEAAASYLQLSEINLNITTIFNVGYFLTADTPECRERLEQLKGMPLHDAANSHATAARGNAMLSQVLLLNDIHLWRAAVDLLGAMFREKGPVATDEYLAQSTWGDDCCREVAMHSDVSRARRVIGDKPINGFRYRIERKRGAGYCVRCEALG